MVCFFAFVGKVLKEVKTWRSAEGEAESWLCRKSTFSCSQYWWHTHTQLFNCLFSRTTRVGRFQKCNHSGFSVAEMMGVAVASAGPYASHLHLILQTPAPHHSSFFGADALPAGQLRCQSTEGTLSVLVKLKGWIPLDGAKVIPFYV